VLVLPFRVLVAVLLHNHRTADIGSPTALPNREEGEPNPHLQSGRADPAERRRRIWQGAQPSLAQQATAPGRSTQNSSAVAGLARFFPEAAPVRIPVQLGRTLESGERASANFTESTVIEFGTPREVLFACKTPLEFADVVRLRNSDGSLDTTASVVAVQYHSGGIAVAARFREQVPNWIVKP
jgi:hypothetical protein